jgi:MGT family glycosyltransferase
MKIGFISLPLSGHLNPMTAVARKLQSRGHEITFIGVPDAGPAIRAAGLKFEPIMEKTFPAGTVAKTWGPVAKMYGGSVLEYSLREISPEVLRLSLAELPDKLMQSGIEALVLDTILSFQELVPLSMGLPYAQIWNVLHTDFSGVTPACGFSWPFEATPEAQAKNIEGLMSLGGLFGPVTEIAKEYADKVGLQVNWSDPTSTFSKRAIITQTPKEFDFPGIPWPEQFVYAGPFYDDHGRQPVAFPWDELNGKPLIYASLGTLVNGLTNIYRSILDAVGTISDAQVVLSIGKNTNASDLGPIPENTIVVNTAPQIELLKRASLCITHAGLNTALESLGEGVPMVAIPIGYDQPGVAARIAYHGVGEFIEVDDLTGAALAKLIQKVRSNASYREKARYFQTVIARTRGLDVAADAIEAAFARHEAVAGKPSAMAHA